MRLRRNLNGEKNVKALLSQCYFSLTHNFMAVVYITSLVWRFFPLISSRKTRKFICFIYVLRFRKNLGKINLYYFNFRTLSGIMYKEKLFSFITIVLS